MREGPGKTRTRRTGGQKEKRNGKNMPEILIIGAGAAGLMAAVFASRSGASVTVAEHNEKPGKKIYLTGKGRCNVTNDCGLEDFLREVPRNPRFLYSALSFFSPQDMIALLEENGCPVEIQRGRRAYPRSMKASDVTKTLMEICRRQGVRFLMNREAAALRLESGQESAECAAEQDGAPASGRRVTGVEMRDGSFLPADRVILATGGLSYPSTGSTGDGLRMAREAGHTVTPLLPSLVGLEAAEAWPAELQGLSLKNVRITLRSGKKTLYTELGEMLFTHFGFSGPLILEASCHLPEEGKPCRLELDLKPGLTPEMMEARLLRELEAGAKKQLKNILPSLLPGRLAEVFPRLCGLPETLACNQISAAQRRSLAERLKCLPLEIRGRRPFSEAVVTRGGVSVREVQPGTMESKIAKGLYFAGEMLDVDAHTGGYNLQIAFSTGALAGYSSARPSPETR